MVLTIKAQNCKKITSIANPQIAKVNHRKHNFNYMIKVENDYEPIIYEQPIYSHIYQNHDQFLLNDYTRPMSNNKSKEKIEKIVEEIAEEKPTECSNTNNIH